MKSWRIFSTRYSKSIFWFGLVLLLLAATALSLWTGSVALSPARVLDVLTGKDTSSTAAQIIFYSRLPRTCAAFLAGAALAVAGMVIQTVLNNPLASPGVIGVNSGAGFAVALVCAVFPAARQYTPLVALSGALIAALLVTGLSWRTGASRITVVLAGVAISALFGAGIDAVVTLVPEALDGVADFRVGGFTGVTMARLVPAGGLIFVSLAVVLSLARQMDVLRLGSDTAQSLGLCVGVVRFVLLFLAAVLAGAAVSFCGLMGFVGLIIPNTMRRLLGEGSLELTAASALGGAFFVIVCDVLSRILFAPFEIPVGIILAFAGAPFFLWLLLRQKGVRA